MKRQGRKNDNPKIIILRRIIYLIITHFNEKVKNIVELRKQLLFEYSGFNFIQETFFDIAFICFQNNSSFISQFFYTRY